MKTKNNLMLLIALTASVSFGQVQKSCLKAYESPKELSTLFEEKSSGKNSGFTFLPLAITNFLTEQYDQVYARFETQMDRLRQVGDKNPLSSSSKTSKIAIDKNHLALTKIQKQLNPSSLSLARFKSTEKQSEDMEKLISEANQCKLQTNTCIENLNMAMKTSDQNIASIENLIQELNQFQAKLEKFKKYIQDEKSRHYGPQDIQYALGSIESKRQQIDATMAIANSILDVNKKNLISANFILEESYMVNQRTKEVRAEGAYNLTDDGKSLTYAQTTAKKESVFKKTWNDLNLKRKNAVHNAKVTLKKYSAPLIAAAVIGTAGTGMIAGGNSIRAADLQRAHQEEIVLAAQLKQISQKNPGFSQAFLSAKSIYSAEERDTALEKVYTFYKASLQFDDVKLIVDTVYYQNNKATILKDFSTFIAEKSH